MYDVIAALPASTLWLLGAGGLLYTFGVAFHLWESLRFQNAIWHVFWCRPPPAITRPSSTISPRHKKPTRFAPGRSGGSPPSHSAVCRRQITYWRSGG